MNTLLLVEAAVEAESILDNIPAQYIVYIVIALAVIKAAEVIVKLTPNKTDDKILGFIKPIANWLSLNVPDIEEVKKKEDVAKNK